MIQYWEQHASISQSATVTATVFMIGPFTFSLMILTFQSSHGSAHVHRYRHVVFIWVRQLSLRHLDEFGNGAADARKDLVRLG